MQHQLKSVITPSTSRLSTRYAVDFRNVPLAEIQTEVVQRVIGYLGKTSYNFYMRKLVNCVKQAPIRFIDLEIAFMMIGIEGSTIILMLIQEWEIADYVTDFDDNMNAFLEAYVPENK